MRVANKTVRLLQCLLATCALFFSIAASANSSVLTVDQAAGRLAGGGYILIMRHSQTVPGTGDPAGFRLEQCDTQRNLSEQGKAHAVSLGKAFRQAGIELSQVRFSQWCRCRDTAMLAFERGTALPALNSTFAGQGDPEGQLAELKAQAGALPAGENVIWVTHQVIASAATGSWTSQGEILATRFVDGQFAIDFRIKHDG